MQVVSPRATSDVFLEEVCSRLAFADDLSGNFSLSLGEGEVVRDQQLMYPTHYIDNILLPIVILSCPLPSSFRNFRQNYSDSSENCFVLIRTMQLLTVLNHLLPRFEAIEVRILYEE